MKINILAFLVIVFVSCDNKSKMNSISKKSILNFKNKYFEKYLTATQLSRSQEMNNQTIKISDKEMKFDLKFFGKKPENGWDLFFSLHGGGQTKDSINENAWIRHKTLYQLDNGILLTPRSPTNTWNMWHQDHIDIFFNQLIRNMIAFHDVNPNRVYLMGYSAGGDGVYQIAPRMADRFAAAAMMAGHPNDASPLNLRNMGFSLYMGGQDTAYNRNGVALEWKEKLKRLRSNDPNGYDHHVEIYQDKGHWMGGLDASAISWLSKFERVPYPSKIVWRQDDILQKRFYWLKVDKPEAYSEIIVNISDQIITVEKSTVSNFVIQLNDELIDMSKPITVKHQGKTLFKNLVYRNKEILEQSLNEYGDPQSFYYGQIPIFIGP
jgi:predicted esterase